MLNDFGWLLFLLVLWFHGFVLFFVLFFVFGQYLTVLSTVADSLAHAV
jgi:hypothetical protein